MASDGDASRGERLGAAGSAGDAGLRIQLVRSEDQVDDGPTALAQVGVQVA